MIVQTALKADAVLDLKPSLKSFDLAEILALSSGLPLAGPQRLHDLIAYITDTSPHRAAAHAKDAKACLDAQLPFLAALDTRMLNPAFLRDPASLSFWLQAQARRYGGSHWVMPRELWRQRAARRAL